MMRQGTASEETAGTPSILKRRRVGTDRMGTILRERRLITAEQLEQALMHQRATSQPLGQVLLDMGLGPQQDIEEWIVFALTVQYGFPRLSLDCFNIDDDTLLLVPPRTARQYCLIPVNRVGSSLTVVMADPLNAKAIHHLEASTSCDIQPLVSTPSEIQWAITEFYPRGSLSGVRDRLVLS